MDGKLNCWQYKNCGREKGGLLADILGECPVSTELKYDGVNGGRGAGRVCWAVTNACCCDPAIGAHLSCHTCDFYRRVVFEQADTVSCKYSSTPE